MLASLVDVLSGEEGGGGGEEEIELLLLLFEGGGRRFLLRRLMFFGDMGSVPTTAETLIAPLPSAVFEFNDLRFTFFLWWWFVYFGRRCRYGGSRRSFLGGNESLISTLQRRKLALKSV